jgi:L-rhamnose mutarotase
MKRMMFHSRLKPECVKEYVREHKRVPPKLLAAYRKAGITTIGCYLKGLDLFVYSEYDPKIYSKAKAALSRNPVEVRWQKHMASLRDQTFGNHEYKEVFFMGK